MPRQAIDANVTIPYWDSALDQPLPVVTDSILWSDDNLGNTEGNVTTGMFANWNIIPECYDFGQLLTRKCTAGNTRLLSDQLIQAMIGHDYYANITCNIHTCIFENGHGGPHAFHTDAFGTEQIIGHMANVRCSPSDPTFWSHHAFMDLLFEEFRDQHQITDAQLEYPTEEFYPEQYPRNHDWWQPMRPFLGVINADGMSAHYTDYYYEYTPRPSSIRCAVDADCTSPSLWCDSALSMCVSKVQTLGSCAGLSDNACADTCGGGTPGCVDDTCLCLYIRDKEQLKKTTEKHPKHHRRTSKKT